MANRIIQTLFKWKKKDGSIDTYYFKNRAKDVIIPNDEEGNARTLESIITKVDTVSEGATKTSAITGEGTNGYILVDNVPVKVYEQPTTPDLAGTYNKVIVDDAGNVVSGELLEDWDGTVSGKITEATSEFTEYSARENIQSGEKTKFIFGKIMKWFSDLGEIAFKDKVEYTDLSTDAQSKIVKTENISQSTTDTSTTKVPSVAVTTALKKSIDAINSNLEPDERPNFTDMNSFFTNNKIAQNIVHGTAIIPGTPIERNSSQWYNVLSFGTSSRGSQLTGYAYNAHNMDGAVWYRHKHDEYIGPWQLVTTQKAGTQDIALNPTYVMNGSGQWDVYATSMSGYVMLYINIVAHTKPPKGSVMLTLPNDIRYLPDQRLAVILSGEKPASEGQTSAMLYIDEGSRELVAYGTFEDNIRFYGCITYRALNCQSR